MSLSRQPITSRKFGITILEKTVSETTATGKKKRTFVIANGTTIARQVVADNNDESVSWEYSDASGQSIRMSGADGTSANVDSGSAELDTLGNNVGTHGSFTDPRNSDAEVSPFNRDPISPEIMCNQDGIVGACELVEMMSGGSFGRYDAAGTFASRPWGLPFEMTGRTPRNHNNPMAIAQEILRATNTPDVWNSHYSVYRVTEDRGIPDQVLYDNTFLNYLLDDKDKKDVDLNTIIDDKTLREKIVSLQNSCKDFLNKFLSILDKDYDKVHRNENGDFDMGALFDRISVKKVGENIMSKKARPGAKAAHYFDGRKRAIAYREKPSAGYPDILWYGVGTFAELFHHAKERGSFSDRDLDDAMEDLIGKEEFKKRKKNLTDSEDGSYNYGHVAHTVINENCK